MEKKTQTKQKYKTAIIISDKIAFNIKKVIRHIVIVLVFLWCIKGIIDVPFYRLFCSTKGKLIIFLLFPWQTLLIDYQGNNREINKTTYTQQL